METPCCPYCTGTATARHTGWGWVWECVPCDARVGCHGDTQEPKGTLANAPLRAARIAAHNAFDALWREKCRRNPEMSKTAVRGKAYKWLARQMHLPPERTHIGMFTAGQCQRVVALCEPYTERIRHALRLAPPRHGTRA